MIKLQVKEEGEKEKLIREADDGVTRGGDINMGLGKKKKN